MPSPDYPQTIIKFITTYGDIPNYENPYVSSETCHSLVKMWSNKQIIHGLYNNVDGGHIITYLSLTFDKLTGVSYVKSNQDIYLPDGTISMQISWMLSDYDPYTFTFPPVPFGTTLCAEPTFKSGIYKNKNIYVNVEQQNIIDVGEIIYTIYENP